MICSMILPCSGDCKVSVEMQVLHQITNLSGCEDHSGTLIWQPFGFIIVCKIKKMFHDNILVPCQVVVCESSEHENLM